MSPAIQSFTGVKQGELLSPCLFLLFITNVANSMEFSYMTLFIMLYTDDIILMSKSSKVVQNLLTSLNMSCNT